jgi:type 1 fimbria pilin
MRRWRLPAGLAVIIALGGPAFADDDVTLKGEIVEASCYTKLGVAKGTGAEHVKCATECAQKGLPLGILTDGDGMFRILGEFAANNNVKLLPFLGKTVETHGTMQRTTDYSRGFNVTKIALAR